MSQLNDIKDQMSFAVYGRKRSEALQTTTCVCHGTPVDLFKYDELSAREYHISALCKAEQDKIFFFDIFA